MLTHKGIALIEQDITNILDTNAEFDDLPNEFRKDFKIVLKKIFDTQRNSNITFKGIPNGKR